MVMADEAFVVAYAIDPDHAGAAEIVGAQTLNRCNRTKRSVSPRAA
jgi:hypothetical protein